MALGDSSLNSRPINAPAVLETNVAAMFGRADALDQLKQQIQHRPVFIRFQSTDADTPSETVKTRGRKRGSTNWTRERFWRVYAAVARGMRRPYRRTHLAAQMELAYGTFCTYLEKWGPPPGFHAPGD